MGNCVNKHIFFFLKTNIILNHGHGEKTGTYAVYMCVMEMMIEIRSCKYRQPKTH